MGSIIPSPFPQSGVIPYRQGRHQLEVLLITSRRRGRWIIPKGYIDLHLDPARSACQEAYEEAGICGKVSDAAIGWYQYVKRGMCRTVVVFTLEVQVVLETWPEIGERERRWFPASVAAHTVCEPALQAMIAALSRTL